MRSQVAEAIPILSLCVCGWTSENGGRSIELRIVNSLDTRVWTWFSKAGRAIQTRSGDGYDAWWKMTRDNWKNDETEINRLCGQLSCIPINMRSWEAFQWRFQINGFLTTNLEYSSLLADYSPLEIIFLHKSVSSRPTKVHSLLGLDSI